jgi:hypothetical protein
MISLSTGSIGTTRREFLRAALGTASFAGAAGFARGAGVKVVNFAPKTIIVTFGGGARDEETFAQEGQVNIPNLMKQLIPQGTFFTQVVNAGILGHYVATTSILTGVYERFDNFIAQPPPNPTLFEYFRKGLKRPARDAWVIAPSNGFQLIGSSSSSAYGPQYGAGVILPKKMLQAAMAQQSGATMPSAMLQDNFENLLYTPTLSNRDTELHLETIESILRISQKDFVQHAQSLDSADELSVFIAKRLMENLSPSLLAMTLHDMDIAHAGAYSLYVDAIQRADRLCGELWATIQSMPEYKARTTLLILPDFGRDADGDPAGNGFQHHRTGGELARTTWLLALGPNIRHNETVNRRIESLDLVPTVGGLHGFATPGAAGKRIQEIS